jgi:tRNA G18 (ribose-2'-O)-methylase SpoU
VKDERAGTDSYRFAQCSDDACRFRFPAPAAEIEGLRCPRCHAAVHSDGFRPPLPPAREETAGAGYDKPAGQTRGAPLAALLDNLRSVHNVGSIFRTADGAGIGPLYLAGITATPEHPRLAKAALGAQSIVSWRYYANNLTAATTLRDAGYTLWALERLPNGRALSLYEAASPAGPLALVIGNERAGIDPALLTRCDAIFSLPMLGGKSSLNAAVAFGIAVYHLRFGLGLAALPMPRNTP